MTAQYADLKTMLCVRAVGTRYNNHGQVVAVVRSVMDNINLQYEVPFDEFIAEGANKSAEPRRFEEVRA